MSFMKSLKGLADDFKNLMDDKDKPKTDSGHTEANRGASDSYYQQQQQPQHAQSYQGQGYGGPPQQQGYGQPQHGYGGPPPPQGHGGPPPGGPQMPPGWLQQWDQNSQRYYYLEQSTGRTQWEPPVPAMSPPPGDMSRNFSGPPGQGYPGQQGYGGYGQQPGYGQPYGQQGYGQQGHGVPPPVGVAHPGGSTYPVEAVKNGEVKKKDKGMGKGALLAAGAGGLVAGGLVGAALADDSSDDGHGHSAAPAAGGYGYGAPPPAGYGDPSYGAYGAPPPQDPQALEHNSDVSSSQRSSLEEARHDYEEAQRKAADSDASSSDIEEAREAREEYQEEIEEAEEEAYDD